MATPDYEYRDNNDKNQWWFVTPSLNDFILNDGHGYPGLAPAFTTTSTLISLGFIPKMKKCNKPLWERFPNGKGLYF